jgi:hypothetical protein
MMQDAWQANPRNRDRAHPLGETTTPSIEGWSVRKFLRPAFTSYGPSSPNFDANLAKDYLRDDDDKVCAVMATETDSRIFVQQGCFTVHTTYTALQLNPHHSLFLDRIIIPSNSVRTIAEEILLCGFRKSTLFPDLTHLAEDLTARYK